MKKLLLAGGGREGTFLLAPLYDALKKNGSYTPLAVLSAGTGKAPIDQELAGCFGLENSFRTIGLCGGTPIETLASMMTGMEMIIGSEQPHLVLACGSDDAALAAALAASRLSVPLAATDSGLRNHVRTDTREINRVLIDSIADLHFVSEHSGEYNLINEGVPDEKVFFAGNLLIDSLAALMQQSGRTDAPARHGLQTKHYVMVMLGLSANSRHGEQLALAQRLLKAISAKTTVLLPLAPGYGDLIENPGFDRPEAIRIIDMPGPGELLALLRDSQMLLTDDGELQAESTVMDVPCLTMRDRTYRPSTLEIGTNVLVGEDEAEILAGIEDLLRHDPHGHRRGRSKIPEKWDGAAAARIV
ncbi:MAG: UDP-N-acetyl glucosamine 2-epimerase, partial [Chlorobiaceae bacterium]|nr:UDP-N-acetyl glucosamine 2-epimerase [Chlorobiaceae bacterium]